MGEHRAAKEFSRREFLGMGMALAGGGMILASCSGGSASGSSGEALKLIYQPGTTTFAQLWIIEKEGWLEEALPEYEITYQQVDAGAVVRDAIVSDDAQVGAGGIAPFLVGYDGGIPWKILTALNDIEMWLMVNDDKFQSLEDFGPDDKIAVVAPDSIQAIILRKAAEEQLGDPRALDNNLVSIPGPDSVAALMNGQIAAHFTAPPYQFIEQDDGARPIVKSYDLFGDHNLISIWAREDYHDENPDVMEAVTQNIQRATDLINDDPERVGNILAEVSQIDPAEETRFLTEENVTFTTEPHGFIAFAEFMQSAELIDEVPGSWEDLVFDNLKGEDGS